MRTRTFVFRSQPVTVPDTGDGNNDVVEAIRLLTSILVAEGPVMAERLHVLDALTEEVA